MRSFDLGIYTLGVIQKSTDHPITVERKQRKKNTNITALTAGAALGRFYLPQSVGKRLEVCGGGRLIHFH
jgi:hypothetical protein